MTLTCYTFFTMGIIGLLASIVVVSAINPIHRIALLIVVFMAGAFMYTLLDFYFLGLTYIIVYVGAIAILFLFVIMMVKASEETITSYKNTGSSYIIYNTSQLTTPKVTNPSQVYKVQYGKTLYFIGFIGVFTILGILIYNFNDQYVGLSNTVESSNNIFTTIFAPETMFTYFFPSWAIDYTHPTDLFTLGYVVYVVYPLAIILIGMALWIVMIGIIASIG